MASPSCSEKERLLDHFPVTEDELDYILSAFYPCVEIFQSECPLLSSLASHVAAASNQEVETTQTRILLERLIPELPIIFQWVLQNVFVVGFSPDHGSLFQKATLLEAIAVLSGRRGSGGRLLLHALFQAAVVPTNHDMDVDHPSSPDGTAKHVASGTVSVSRLMHLIYRFARASCQIEVQVDNHEQNDTESSTPSSTSVDGRTTTSRLAVDEAQLSSSSTSLPPTWFASHSRPSSIARPSFMEWVDGTATNLHTILAAVFDYYFFAGVGRQCSGVASLPLPLRRPSSMRFPYIQTSDASSTTCRSQFWNDPWDPIPIKLALMGLGRTRWHCLYRNDRDGLSFPMFGQALLAYAGPVCILIQTKRGDCLGYYTEIPWKAGAHWYTTSPPDDNNNNNKKKGSTSAKPTPVASESFLFRLVPSWTLYRRLSPDLTSGQRKGSSTFHQYLNMTPTHRPGAGNILTGLAVGGVASDAPRLHLTATLEQCRAGSYDFVFQSGKLLGGSDEDDAGACDHDFFDVDCLEAWALYDDESVLEQNLRQGRLQASIREQARLRLQQVDRQQFVDDFASGAFYNNVYAHREHIRGRADFVAAQNNHGHVYYYLEDKPPSPQVHDHQLLAPNGQQE